MASKYRETDWRYSSGMQRREFLGGLAAGMAAKAAAGFAPSRPNVIVILADDMGYSDIGCHGGEVETPNLDALAKGGVRFTHFYNTARCCPTRASLLSGLYAHQTSVGHMVDNGRELPGYRGDLSQSCVTLGEAMKHNGYQTRMAGKWHVTPVTPSKANWPNQRGFDRFYGTIHGAGSFYAPVGLTEDNEPASSSAKDFYYTDAIADKSTQYIRDCAGKAEPFFLYTAFTSPHWPMHAFADDIAKYRKRYEVGWDALREERHRRQVEMGIVDKAWQMAPRDASVPAWKDAPNKAWEVERMAVYAAMIDRMDRGIGRMIAALKEKGVFEDTLICFLSDNGGCAEVLGPRMNAYHVPKQQRDGSEMRIGNLPEVMPGPEGTYQSYGVGWANASNTPFRLYKHWVHEGGISTPFVAHWPRGVKKAGEITHQPGHLIDVMATCVDAARGKYPKLYQGRTIQPREGMSLLPALRGKDTLSKRTLCWEHEGNRAIREGKMKLVSKFPGTWELYDLAADRTEQKDLSTAQPRAAAAMMARYENWAKRVGAEDWDKVRAAPRVKL
jgi:arylsulfatase A-like enzyme